MRVRTGTVGYSYREWMDLFYPAGTHPRRQLQIYSENFEVCELTQFTHQMPDVERMARFTAQVKSDLSFFVRIHNTFTQCADVGLALSLARHFRRAMEPLFEAGKLAGLVGSFPYVFKNTPERREYLEDLSELMAFEGTPLQLDFRHPSWLTDSSVNWMRENGLGLVCVDEPALPGLVPAMAVATAGRVMVRLHGRNAEGWWSGNPATRYDYCYSEDELHELGTRYLPLIHQAMEVCFVFQNNWEARSVRNAIEWKKLISGITRVPIGQGVEQTEAPVRTFDRVLDADVADEDAQRPPTSLTLAEVKSRVNQALQGSFDMPMVTSDD